MILPLLASASAVVVRDDFGVPYVRGESAEATWTAVGRSVAEDRWKQMDLSRRLARGRLAAYLGADYVKSDMEILKSGYTDEELAGQFEKLPSDIKDAWRFYAAGVNEHRAQVAPDAPEWTTVDSMAIMVRLLQQFGRGGGGELRNLAILGYLQGRKPLEGHVLDAFDDLAWQTDARSLPTAKGTFRTDSIFPPFRREDTERQLAALPKLSLFELLPLIQLAKRETSTLMAERLNLPYKAGSYAVVVPASRSVTGEPLLMNGPQMGFRNPSIVHLIGMSAPGLKVQGMDVPGIPGVLVGRNPYVAWGLTSGVSDLEDVLFVKDPQIVKTSRTLEIKNATAATVERKRTDDGLVLWQKPNVGAFVLARSYEGQEWQSYRAVARLWTAKDGGAAQRAVSDATMSFNFFWADRKGAGYRHLGQIPLRTGGDPRLPAIGTRRTAWKGFLPFSQMPGETARNDVVSNWNNLPILGWPNGDTPVWGEGFRGRTLREALDRPKLAEDDLVLAAKSISMEDENWPALSGFYGAASGWDGMRLPGDERPSLFQGWIANLRRELFREKVGDFVTPEYAGLILQPSLMLHALRGETKVDYLAGRSATEVAAKAREGLVGTPFVPPIIPVTGSNPIPYSNRGTYIQVVRLGKGSLGRNIAPPGVAEDGSHRFDMATLARAWGFRPMVPWD
ncbi:hypothetical protein BH11ARM2_BH11ARM2_37220 [soil metagenome]